MCALLANVNRDPKKRKQPFTVTEFLLSFEPHEPEVMDAEAIKKAMYAWADARNKLPTPLPQPDVGGKAAKKAKAKKKTAPDVPAPGPTKG